MHKSPLFVAVLITMIVGARLVAAQTPEGVEPGVWAKVEAQLQAQGVNLLSKAGRDVPVEVAKLLPTPDLVGEDSYFGRAVALDDDTMVVGAYDSYDDYDYPGGTAFIFQREQGGPDAWGLVARLTSSVGPADDRFGCAVSISGDTVVVGAYHDDDDGINSGSAYIFGRNQGGADAWQQVAKLTASDGGTIDHFGYSVSISCDIVTVGSPGDNGSSGSAYIFGRDQGGTNTWGQVAKLMASDGASYDHFGYSVSISNDTVAVGAYRNRGTAAYGSGSAYIFGRNQGGTDAWGQIVKLTASDGASNDEFGKAVAISVDLVVVGAPEDDDNGTDSGSAYIFGRNHGGANAWGQMVKITAFDGATEDQFGLSLSISGDTVVVGAYQDNDNGYHSGSAYIFDRDHGGTDVWGQAAKITASDGETEDQFGLSLSISGDTVVVGARKDDDNGTNSGSAYLFARNEGGADSWGQITKKIAPGNFYATEDYFGISVSISNETLVVGAHGDDENSINSGSAYIFEKYESGTNSWGLVAKLMASDGGYYDSFGISVAINGDTVVVGAHHNDANAENSGAAYIFDRNHGGTDTWGEVAKLTASDGSNNSYFGISVSISDNTVVVGASRDDENSINSGSAYIFEKHESGTNTWGQVAKLTASDGASYDYLGYSVSISIDTVVIGASGNDDNGLSSGSAYIFDRNHGGTDAWGQTTKINASDGADNDSFGRTVSIANDTVVIGSYQDDDNGTDSGSAYIFGRNQGGENAWGEVAKITASDGEIDDSFGSAVSISGDTIIVGANGDDDNNLGSGSAYVFGRNRGGPETWGQMAKMTASNGTNYDRLGDAVSISGNTVIVGAPGSQDFDYSSGSAYVFDIIPNLEILSVGSTPDTGDGVLGSGEWAGVAITDFSILFSKAMLDPAGDTDPADVTNPSNWLLVAGGSDGIIQTVSCATGPAGDDLAMAPDTFVYTDAALTVTFRANGGTALDDGAYSLFACGTLESTLGLPLDGNSDGIGGDDYVLPFAIDTVMPANPVLSSSSHTIGVWSNDSTIDISWSGAADAKSGIGGYSVVMDGNPATEPDAVIDIPHSVDPHTTAWQPPVDGDSWYYHLRTCDVAGNCAAAQHLGPFWIDTTPPTAVADLISTSHAVDVPLHDVTIDVQWTAATDNLNGVAGYAVEFPGSASWTCDEVQDTTGTTTASPNLADGEWYVYVCAVDGIGNWGDVASAGPFVIDTTAPIVVAIGSEGGTIDGHLGEGEDALTAITQLEVSFSEVISNPAGNDTVGDLTNPEFYRVLNLGADGLLTTVDCTSALGGDDIEILQTGYPFAWAGDETVSILGLDDWGLPQGRYTLMVCGLQDLAGHELVGPWTRTFAISANNLLLDPNFEDGTLSVWDTVSPNGADIMWADADPSTPASGVVVIDPVGSPMGETYEITQCLDVVEGTPFVLGGISRINSTEPSAPTLKVMARYFRNPGCTDELGLVETTIAQGDTAGEWGPRLYLSSRAPVEALSARVGFIVEGGTATDFTLSIDEAAFFENLIFVDGFEGGDLSWWSWTQP